MDYVNEKPRVAPAFQSPVGRGWDVVRSVVAEARQTGDPRVTVEGDPVPRQQDYRVSLPSSVVVVVIVK